MKSRHSQALLMDLGDSLVHLKQTFLALAATLISKYTVQPLGASLVQQAWNYEWHTRRLTKGDGGAHNLDKRKEYDFWVELSCSLCAHLGANGVSDEAIDWLARSWGAGPSYELYPEVFETLFELRKNHVRLVMVSNAFPSTWEIIKATYLDELFDDYVLSYSCAYAKPQPEIYQIALRQAGVWPEQALFVDDYPEYVSAAAGLSIPAALINHGQDLQINPWSGDDGMMVFRRIGEVGDYFLSPRKATRVISSVGCWSHPNLTPGPIIHALAVQEVNRLDLARLEPA